MICGAVEKNAQRQRIQAYTSIFGAHVQPMRNPRARTWVQNRTGRRPNLWTAITESSPPHPSMKTAHLERHDENRPVRPYQNIRGCEGCDALSGYIEGFCDARDSSDTYADVKLRCERRQCQNCQLDVFLKVTPLRKMNVALDERSWRHTFCGSLGSSNGWGQRTCVPSGESFSALITSSPNSARAFLDEGKTKLTKNLEYGRNGILGVDDKPSCRVLMMNTELIQGETRRDADVAFLEACAIHAIFTLPGASNHRRRIIFVVYISRRSL